MVIANCSKYPRLMLQNTMSRLDRLTHPEVKRSRLLMTKNSAHRPATVPPALGGGGADSGGSIATPVGRNGWKLETAVHRHPSRGPPQSKRVSEEERIPNRQTPKQKDGLPSVRTDAQVYERTPEGTNELPIFVVFNVQKHSS